VNERTNNKKHLPVEVGRRGVVVVVVVAVVVVTVAVVGPAPKWNEKGRMSKGCQGRGSIQPMGSTYPIVVVGELGGRPRWWQR